MNAIIRDKSILLVDDDRVFRSVLGRSLSRRGMRVLAADSLSEAFGQIMAHPLHYTLLDLKIGLDSGLDLIPELLDHQPHCRIVVLTGYASIATAIEAIKLGATYYLAKPVDTDTVIDALHKDQANPQQPVAQQPLSVRQLEWEHIQRVLADHQGNISATARSLNMHRRTLQRKLAKFAARR